VSTLNEFNRRRLWALGFVVAGALAANAFLYVDGKQPALMLLGLVLGFVVVFGAMWAGFRWHALRCPHCGDRFSPLLPTSGKTLWRSPLSSRCASCQRGYSDA
jgi:hypothetical protein